MTTEIIKASTQKDDVNRNMAASSEDSISHILVTESNIQELNSNVNHEKTHDREEAVGEVISDANMLVPVESTQGKRKSKNTRYSNTTGETGSLAGAVECVCLPNVGIICICKFWCVLCGVYQVL
jgi:hypothetical protein